MSVAIPDHHLRYARAWELYSDPELSQEVKKILEDEMDSAQSSFDWDEFQKFKLTLPGFVEAWEVKAAEMRGKLFEVRGR